MTAPPLDPELPREPELPRDHRVLIILPPLLRLAELVPDEEDVWWEGVG